MMKRKKTLETHAINHSNNFRHPAHDDEQQQQQQQLYSNTQEQHQIYMAGILKCILVRRTAAYNSVV